MNIYVKAFAVAAITLTACGIPEEQYLAVVKSRDSLQVVVKDLHKQIDELKGWVKNRDYTLEDLNDKMRILQETYDRMKANSTEEMKGLLAELEQTRKDLEAREQRLHEVESKLRARDSAITALHDRLTQALLGFKESGLSIDIRNGKVYVSLSNQLLFNIGSVEIDKRGKEALKELATVLNTQPDISIVVEGHTDIAPVVSKGGRFQDNWDLSVLRSTEVTRTLTQEGVDPKRIIASGRGEYFPVEQGDSPEIRAKNRRTEIILTPNLEELFDIIKTK
ncbi:OmpA family protein [Ignavibacteria bacterium]|nr:OmpA family protein [Bacteroidota bacterium]MCZ2132566.1 OmpA family protein [Bacteroidota bacterium]